MTRRSRSIAARYSSQSGCSPATGGSSRRGGSIASGSEHDARGAVDLHPLAEEAVVSTHNDDARIAAQVRHLHRRLPGAHHDVAVGVDGAGDRRHLRTAVGARGRHDGVVVGPDELARRVEIHQSSSISPRPSVHARGFGRAVSADTKVARTVPVVAPPDDPGRVDHEDRPPDARDQLAARRRTPRSPSCRCRRAAGTGSCSFSAHVSWLSTSWGEIAEQHRARLARTRRSRRGTSTSASCSRA